MKANKKRPLVCVLLAALMLLLCSCGQGDAESSPEQDPGETLLPISVNGREIRVGETTVQTLLDEGLDVSWLDENYERITVDPEEELEANAYYTGGSIRVTDGMFFLISFVTDEEPIPLGQAVIARLELSTVGEEDESALNAICFDGVPITEMTREKAGEMYPDWTGNEYMWLHYGLEYKYDLNFAMDTGRLTSFTVEREYDVDWNG